MSLFSLTKICNTLVNYASYKGFVDCGGGTWVIASESRIYQSVDSGASWTEKVFTENDYQNPENEYYFSSAIGHLIKLANGDVIAISYIDQGDYNPHIVYLYKSVDDGATWTKTDITPEDFTMRYPFLLEVDSLIYCLSADTSQRRHVATFNINTLEWVLLYTSDVIYGYDYYNLIHISGDIFLASMGSSIYKSIDGGATWSLKLDLWTAGANVELYPIYYDSYNAAYFAGHKKIYKSIDDGDTWSLKYTYPYVHSVTNFLNYSIGSHSFIIAPVSYRRIIYSVDKGNTWAITDSLFTTKDYSAFMMVLDDDTIISLNNSTGSDAAAATISHIELNAALIPELFYNSSIGLNSVITANYNLSIGLESAISSREAYNLSIGLQSGITRTSVYNSILQLSNGMFILPVMANVCEQLLIPCDGHILTDSEYTNLPFTISGG